MYLHSRSYTPKHIHADDISLLKTGMNYAILAKILTGCLSRTVALKLPWLACPAMSLANSAELPIMPFLEARKVSSSTYI